MRAEQTSFLFGANAPFIEELYARYLGDPNAVDSEWRTFFEALAEQQGDVLAEVRGASWAPNGTRVIGAVDPETLPSPANRNVKGNGKANGAAAPALIAGQTEEAIRAAAHDTSRAFLLIRSYRIRGHLEADLDPLGLIKRELHRELDPATYGFGENDWDRPILIFGSLGLGESATLRQIWDRLRKTYCGKIGVEYMHISDPDQKAWIQERIEHIENHTEFTVEGRRAILERVVEAEGLERYLGVKFVGTKRFGLDGSESLIPGLEQILKRGGQLGIRDVVIGMPHRGRLNTLVHVLHKSYTALFSEFQGRSSQPEEMRGSGDVKYHLGASADREFDGTTIHVSLAPNPSHLEAVNPVVLGKARAKQDQRGDVERGQVMAILMHGDAAFAGQGLVAESLDLSDLGGYRIGGTIHYVVNNQIGFTTLPTYSRSGPYCTEVAKIVQAPILHVNGDDPEAVVHVSRIATEYRQHFKRDIVIDMFCYRRHGHNESDEPMFTQPLMYKEIGAHKTVKEVYAARLEAEGVVTAADVAGLDAALREKLDKALEAANQYKPNKADWLEGRWAGLTVAPGEEDRKGVTAVELDRLLSVGHALCEAPKGFDLNRKIARQLQEKRKTIDTGENIDWATGEALAWGTLLAESTPVRLSGQDSGRGTFSQRHSVLVDQTNESKYIPLNHVAPEQARFEVIDSPLERGGRAGLRVRLFVGRAQCAGDVGGAVRRLRQRRAGHHRPVHLLGREQVAAHERPRHAAAARLRGAGTGAQLGPPRALPAALGRGQLAGDRADDARQLFPCAAPPDAPLVPQAAGGDDAEVAAAPQGLRLDPGRFRAGHVVPPHPRRRPTSSPTTPRSGASSCARARSTSTSWPSAASARSRTSPSCASSSSIPSRSAGSACGCRSIPMPRWCGARRSPRTWAPGISSIAASSGRWPASTSRPRGRSISAGPRRRRRRPARRARMSRNRPIWSTAR